VVGIIVKWIERRIDDGPLEIALSILTPFAAYLAAEHAHASGVLAVVASGLYLSWYSPQFLSASVRFQARAVWESATFIINGLVFVVIGLQLPGVLEGIRDHKIGALLLYGALFSAIVIVLRLLWTFPGAWVASLLQNRLQHQPHSRPPGKQVFVAGWTGMRGVVSLAAAIAVPDVLADGRAFPQRNLIIFLTFSVILVTLVLQGLTLPPLIRALGLVGSGGHDTEELEARRTIAGAALAHLQEARAQDPPEFGPMYEDIAGRYAGRLARLSQENSDTARMSNKELQRHRQVLADLLRVERNTAARLRIDGCIHDEVLRNIENELDLREMHMELS
jgi:CPA1 family monovalent cation:H+ antiporter